MSEWLQTYLIVAGTAVLLFSGFFLIVGLARNESVSDTRRALLWVFVGALAWPLVLAAMIGLLVLAVVRGAVHVIVG